MSDIIERLRELDKKGYQPLTGAIGDEAAREIERLREESERLHVSATHWSSAEAIQQTIDVLLAIQQNRFPLYAAPTSATPPQPLRTSVHRNRSRR